MKEVVIFQIVFGMVHGQQPYKGFPKIPHIYISFNYSSLKITKIYLERPYRFVKGALCIAKEEDYAMEDDSKAFVV
jgi:hypothetical protein